jgi:uncharacterized Zn finger protein
VRVVARGDRVLARCDCPYAEDWGEWCEHVVAVLLALARGRVTVDEQPTVRELLAPSGPAEAARPSTAAGSGTVQGRERRRPGGVTRYR